MNSYFTEIILNNFLNVNGKESLFMNKNIDKMTDITQELIDEISSTKVKQIIIADKQSPQDRAIIESVKKIRNPFAMLEVKHVMKDLKACDTVVYKLFKRPDFPAITVGKTYKVMLISYLLWKMQRRD